MKRSNGKMEITAADIALQCVVAIAVNLAVHVVTQSRAAAAEKISPAGPLSVASPDGKIVVNFEAPAPASAGVPRWRASFHGRPLLGDCRLGLETSTHGELLHGARVVSASMLSVDRRIPVLFGKASRAANRYQSLRMMLANPAGIRTVVEFRCFDDAVALRYEVPRQRGMGRITITDERTSFSPVGNPAGYVQYLENYRTSHEHEVSTSAADEIKPGVLVDMPATFGWPDGTYLAITEAALRRYAGMALMRADRPGACDLECRLTPRDDGPANGPKVVRPLPMATPWRVALVAARPGALLESNTLYCLNDPPAFKDSTWIKPGKITFSWWNGDVYYGKRGEPILSVAMAKRYIDFCARSGIAFHSVVADETVTPWYHQSNTGVVPGPDTDVTRVRDDLDLAGIRSYAESKGVRLWTWVHQGALRGRVEAAFAAFEKMGWSGMMVDFFDHDDQETVEFAEEILQAAARHHIAIHFHGVWKPTGMQRTYPNLMNHEGALNLEYMKWGDRCTPEHTLLLTFTRLIAGPMDYHAGGFRAVTRAEFTPHNVAPNVLGTRCFGLAMYVCFANPIPMVADYPAAYEGQPGFDFLEAVPTYWDETRVLTGDVGELLVTARRKGTAWYVGGM
ncbi:MAG TPA: glycoside hydrolase family 97 catalytic domain-containing protein, partial [Chthonomonadaceae bacterium]|nr:glycoside hydrolase family 97 catalytic domain-containing protein [Chthonomonadaceae bacterium]